MLELLQLPLIERAAMQLRDRVATIAEDGAATV
jgi:hypothetical protein